MRGLILFAEQRFQEGHVGKHGPWVDALKPLLESMVRALFVNGMAATFVCTAP